MNVKIKKKENYRKLANTKILKWKNTQKCRFHIPILIKFSHLIKLNLSFLVPHSHFYVAVKELILNIRLFKMIKLSVSH